MGTNTTFRVRGVVLVASDVELHASVEAGQVRGWDGEVRYSVEVLERLANEKWLVATTAGRKFTMEDKVLRKRFFLVEVAA